MIAFIKKEIFIFLVMGCIYTNIELVLRGFTHPSMIILGGLCGMLIGLINNIAPNKNLYKQCFLSMLIVTFLEFIFGYILNIKMGLNVWDYSDLPFNFMGQVSLIFSIFWFFLSIIQERNRIIDTDTFHLFFAILSTLTNPNLVHAIR